MESLKNAIYVGNVDKFDLYVNQQELDIHNLDEKIWSEILNSKTMKVLAHLLTKYNLYEEAYEQVCQHAPDLLVYLAAFRYYADDKMKENIDYVNNMSWGHFDLARDNKPNEKFIKLGELVKDYFNNLLQGKVKLIYS